MFTYQQSTGVLSHDGQALWTGYSGNGPDINRPESQAIKMHGPLPQGRYTIGHPYAHPHLGPVTMNLEPAPANEMFGRGDFRIHGDNSLMNRTASDGCIIMPLATRIKVAD